MATYDQLTAWAGREHVTRAGRDVVASWRIPECMKTQLAEVGIPVAERLIERVVVQSEPDPVLHTSRGPLHRLTEHTDPHSPFERTGFGVDAESGAVYFVMPDGEASQAPHRPPRASQTAPSGDLAPSPTPATFRDVLRHRYCSRLRPRTDAADVRVPSAAAPVLRQPSSWGSSVSAAGPRMTRAPVTLEVLAEAGPDERIPIVAFGLALAVLDTRGRFSVLTVRELRRRPPTARRRATESWGTASQRSFEQISW